LADLWRLICGIVFPSEMTGGLKQDHPVESIPAQRPGTFDEIASTFLYTIGTGGAYLNGNCQIIDGGRLSNMPATY
jgi:hypothetical protein